MVFILLSFIYSIIFIHFIHIILAAFLYLSFSILIEPPPAASHHPIIETIANDITELIRSNNFSLVLLNYMVSIY